MTDEDFEAIVDAVLLRLVLYAVAFLVVLTGSIGAIYGFARILG